MSTSEHGFVIILDNCDKLDLLDIEEELAAFSPALQVVDESEHHYGEPGAVILVLEGAPALSPLLFSLANHAKGFSLTEESLTPPDGRERKLSLKVVATDFGPPSPDELRKLSKFPDIDATKIAEAYRADHAPSRQANL
jgi:hypothetical protein